MILKDERDFFVHDIEILAEKLEHKSKDEILEILDNGVNRLCYLKYSGEDKNKWYNRLAMIPLLPVLYFISFVKWVLTGQMHLDTWQKKYKIVDKMIKLVDANVK